MASSIKNIPVLKEKSALIFVEKADKALQEKGKTDFSKEVSTAQKILLKANLK